MHGIHSKELYTLRRNKWEVNSHLRHFMNDLLSARG